MQSLLAVWLFTRFEMPVATAAQVFFAMNMLAAVSFLAAVPTRCLRRSRDGHMRAATRGLRSAA